MSAMGDEGSKTAPSSEVRTASSTGSEISSFQSPLCASPARFVLKPGQFLHDAESAESLASFTRRTCSMSVFSLFFDYTTVIAKDTKENCSVGESHPMLNRFKDVRCFDKNRVKVKHPDGTHDFLHANYVDGFRERNKFILTQAPLEQTNEQFWAMIFQENVVIIVALIALDDKQCRRYMPIKNGTTVNFGAYTIEHHGTQQIRDTYDATILKIRHGSEPERKLLHICYFDWPDKGTPTRPTEMLNLIADMNYNRRLMMEEAEKSGWLKSGTQSPIVVHCLAGVGRSGTLAALDICCRKLDYTEKQPTGPMVDVKDAVLRLRTQREMAVQNPEQYLFLHLAVIEYALRQRYYDDVDTIDLSSFNGYTV
uniref:Tyrosine-protein phosphatase domain-containing protein n=1 Tax=Parascaris univalens TaxID=6257 RepID=A0A915AAS4_PARUN